MGKLLDRFLVWLLGPETTQEPPTAVVLPTAPGAWNAVPTRAAQEAARKAALTGK